MVTIETHKSKITQAREESLHELVARLDIPVSDISIIDCAFTHTSYANEHKSKHIHHNQRLEFLGDAVLDLIIGEYLFKTYPDMAFQIRMNLLSCKVTNTKKKWQLLS